MTAKAASKDTYREIDRKEIKWINMLSECMK